MNKGKKIAISAFIMGCTLLCGSKISANARTLKIKHSTGENISYQEYLNATKNKDVFYVTSYIIGAYEFTIYEYSNSREFDSFNDKYLGLAINHDKDVDVNVTVTETEYFGDTISVSGGYNISVSGGVKIFGCGVDVGFEEEFEIGSSWSTTTEKDVESTWTFDSTDADGLWYYYDQQYTANYLVVVKINGKYEKAAKVKNVDGILPSAAFLQKTPKLLTPLAYKC